MISPTYYADESVIGGGERYVHELCREMGKRTSVTCISFGATRATIQRENYVLERHVGTTAFGCDRNNPFGWTWLGELMSATVIHVHQISTLVSDLATVIGTLLRKPVFVTDHGGGGGRILHQRCPWILRNQIGIAQSRYAASLLEAKGVDDVCTVPGGVDLRIFETGSPPAKGRDIVFVGRLLDHKGPHLLLQALKKLPEWGGRAWIFGRIHDRDYAEKLRQLAFGMPVTLVHDASDSEVASAIATACLLVNPAVTPRDAKTGDPGISELMGISVLEAMAAGTPVVVSTAGALSEIVEATGHGAVFEEGDVDELARTLHELLFSPCLPSANLIDAVRPFSWPVVAARISEIYLSFSQN